jgi:hypothetical protein
MDIVEMAIQVGEAREGQLYVLKIYHLNLGKLSLLQIKTTTDPLDKSQYTIKQTNLHNDIFFSTFVMHHVSTSCTKISLKS